MSKSSLEDRLRQIIREEVERTMDAVYTHGYNAGRREVLRGEIDRDSYRRGYFSGYHAARTGQPEAIDPKPQRRRRAHVGSAV